jgi:hypothetical protein
MANDCSRSKAMYSSCTSTNYAKTPKATRTSQWKRCHFGKTAAAYHRPTSNAIARGFQRLRKSKRSSEEFEQCHSIAALTASE